MTMGQVRVEQLVEGCVTTASGRGTMLHHFRCLRVHTELLDLIPSFESTVHLIYRAVKTAMLRSHSTALHKSNHYLLISLLSLLFDLNCFIPSNKYRNYYYWAD